MQQTLASFIRDFALSPSGLMMGTTVVLCTLILLVLYRDVRRKGVSPTDDNPWRIRFGLVYLLVAGILLSIFMFNEPWGDFDGFELNRFIWTIAWTFVGFYGAAYDSAKQQRWRWLTNSNDPWWKIRKVGGSYFIRYLIIVMLLASLNFGILNAIQAVRGYVFYFVAAPVAVGLGYIVDIFAELHTTVNRYLSGHGKE